MPDRGESNVQKTVLVHGLVSGVLIAVLQLIQYRSLVLEHSVKPYGALVALFFSGLGIWLGLKLTRVREVHTARLFDKLSARGRTQAVRRAKEEGRIP